MRSFRLGLIIAQAVALVRLTWRLLATSRGIVIQPGPARVDDSVTVIVPVLNERDRLPACLASLATLASEVRGIIVVDGGSSDGTQAVAARSSLPNLRFVDASPIPPEVNGKAWGLAAAATHVDTDWILIIDADVSVRSGLVPSMVNHARTHDLNVVSVATRQRLTSTGLEFFHPSMLATLVYRFGIPGVIPTRAETVQANGQCMLVRRQMLEDVGGFERFLGTMVEDISLARAVTRAGGRTGLFETAREVDLVNVTMYGSAAEAWSGWTRSLGTRDQHLGARWWIQMGELTITLGAWLPLLLWTRGMGKVGLLALIGACMRFGVAAGTRRAYVRPGAAYWLSPLADPLVVARIWQQSLKRRHHWRGRLVRPERQGRS